MKAFYAVDQELQTLELFIYVKILLAKCLRFNVKETGAEPFQLSSGV